MEDLKPDVLAAKMWDGFFLDLKLDFGRPLDECEDMASPRASQRQVSPERRDPAGSAPAAAGAGGDPVPMPSVDKEVTTAGPEPITEELYLPSLSTVRRSGHDTAGRIRCVGRNVACCPLFNQRTWRTVS